MLNNTLLCIFIYLLEFRTFILVKGIRAKLKCTFNANVKSISIQYLIFNENINYIKDPRSTLPKCPAYNITDYKKDITENFES